MHNQNISKSLTASLMATAATTVTALFWQAAHFTQESAVAHLGPFNLIAIQKIPLPGGMYQLTFSPLAGILWLEAAYFAACLIYLTYRSGSSPP